MKGRLNYRIAIGFCLIFLSSVILAQVTYTKGGDLQTAVNAGMSGDTFVVKDGSYKDFEASFTAIADPTNPIVIKAQTVGGVTLTGESHFTFKKAAGIILQGFVIDGVGDNTLVKLEGCNNIRLTQNVFELVSQDAIKWVYIGGIWNDNTFQNTSHHNRIDHNIFQNKANLGHYITVDGTNDGDKDYRQSQYDRIDHNYFKNNGPRAANEQESIRIGWSDMSMSSGFTIVEYNLFEDCDGDPEIVSVKSCDNIVRYNTFRGCYGTLSLRHGNRNRVEGNFFFGNEKPVGSSTIDGNTSTLYTGGLRIYGTDHVVINNYFEGLNGTKWDAPITLTQGDAIDGSSTSWSKHFRPERITIAYNTLVNNTYGIELGFDNNNNYSKKIEDITLVNNIVTSSTNSLINYVEGNSTGAMTWANNVFYPTGSATLTSNSTTFSASQIEVTDPKLTKTGSLWKATVQTPTKASGKSGFTLDKDMDGQTRPTVSSVGADNYSQADVIIFPLKPVNVGPNATDSTTTTTNSIKLFDDLNILVYPNPSSQFITINNIPSTAKTVRLVAVNGQEIRLNTLQESEHKLHIADVPNGTYQLIITENNNSYSKKIIILK
jgi:poly(beta-D-mannuronate) lyase